MDRGRDSGNYTDKYMGAVCLRFPPLFRAVDAFSVLTHCRINTGNTEDDINLHGMKI